MIKSYVSYFVSYLLYNLGETSNIQKIILFGSVAKGEEKKQSDVDIFIEVKMKNKNFEKKVKKIIEKFYKSREALIFKNKKIENKINLIVGKLNEWTDLKKSIESTGILLYGNYISDSGISGKKYSIFFWDKIKKNRGAFLNKIYGFKIKGKKYSGLIETLNARKLGKSSIMVPVENREEILKLFKHYGVNAKVVEVYI